MPLPTEGTRDTPRDPRNIKSHSPFIPSFAPPNLNIGGFTPMTSMGAPVFLPNPNMPGFSVDNNFDPLTGNALRPDDVIPGANFERKRPGIDLPEMSPIQIALAQLDELLNSGMQSPTMPDEGDLQAALDEAAAGINQQYGAQIGAIRHQNQGARNDVREGSAEVQKLYKALNRSYRKSGQAEARQGEKLSNQLQNIGERGAQAVTTQANEMNQAALQGAAGLGLADLGADLVGQTNKSAQQLGNRSISRGTNAALTQSRIAGNNRNFFNTSGQAARLEGVNRSADMYADLQDYLQQNRDQISALAGERAAAIAQAKAGIQSSFGDSQMDAYNMMQDQQQQLFENKMALLQLAMSAQQEQESGGGAGQATEDFYEMLPKQISGPSRILNEMNDPTVSGIYEQLSGRGSMQRGYTGNKELGTDQPLVDNYANMQDWAGDALGNDVWGRLTTAQRNAVVAALLSQLQGFGY